MNEDLPSEENIELTEEEISNSFLVLAGIYSTISTVAALYHKFGLPALRLKDKMGQLTPLESNTLHGVLDYIGNNRNGILVGFSMFVTDFVISEIEQQNIEKESVMKILKKIREWFPYFILTLFWIANLDTEMAQILPVSFGTPKLLDVPAGLFGVLAGSVFYEAFRKKVRPLMEYLEYENDPRVHGYSE